VRLVKIVTWVRNYIRWKSLRTTRGRAQTRSVCQTVFERGGRGVITSYRGITVARTPRCRSTNVGKCAQPFTGTNSSRRGGAPAVRARGRTSRYGSGNGGIKKRNETYTKPPANDRSFANNNAASPAINFISVRPSNLRLSDINNRFIIGRESTGARLIAAARW